MTTQWIASILATAVLSSALTLLANRLWQARGTVGGQSIRAPARLRLILLAAGLALAVMALAAGVYAIVGGHGGGGPDANAAPSVQTSGPAAAGAHPGGDVAAMVAQLEARMKRQPGDPAGWRLLGWSYMRTDRYADAVNAYGKAIALAPGSAEDQAALGEALARDAGSVVTPSAVAAFRQAIKIDPREPRARYYLALAKAQRGDRAGAMSDWIDLLRGAPPDAPWVPQVRAYVEAVGREQGEDVSARLPQATGNKSSAPTEATAAPSSIEAMVDGLEARLHVKPHDPDGWIRLLRSRMVLGEGVRAGAAYRDALDALADAPAQRDQVRSAARDLKVPGA